MLVSIVDEDSLEVIGRVKTIEEAEEVIAALEHIIPADVHRGRFGVDAPEWMLK